MEKQSPTPTEVRRVRISAEEAGQRIDNYLFKFLKGVPKSRVYRILRKGEVRVNGKRIDSSYRLQDQDEIRIPPIRVSAEPSANKPPLEMTKQLTGLFKTITDNILFEDERMLAINKPSGLAVHGGSGLRLGLIEILRRLYPKLTNLELVHRLDRDTSGVILIAKKRSALTVLHAAFRDNTVEKTYLCLVAGRPNQMQFTVDKPLKKNTLQSGERIVRIDDLGKPSVTRFEVLQRFNDCCLVAAKPKTGRTHQIRVHAQAAGHPIAGDEKYGDKEFNSKIREFGLKRLFLHAAKLVFVDPNQNAAEQRMKKQLRTIEAPLEAALLSLLKKLNEL